MPENLLLAQRLSGFMNNVGLSHISQLLIMSSKDSWSLSSSTRKLSEKTMPHRTFIRAIALDDGDFVRRVQLLHRIAKYNPVAPADDCYLISSFR